MTLFGEHEARRKKNAAVFEAMGISTSSNGAIYKTIRDGTSSTIFTIGYERRSLDELISSLLDTGVEILVDVRERPMSRKPDFRKKMLSDACSEAGIDYQSWTRLGSTAHQRDLLKESGNIGHFMSRFKDFAKRGRSEELDELATLASNHEIALICYERAHEECHRSVVAELAAERIDASIVAIL